MLNYDHSWVDDPQTRIKLQAANFTIFASIVCADASYEKLCTVAKYFAWVSSVLLCVFHANLDLLFLVSILYGTTVRDIAPLKTQEIKD